MQNNKEKKVIILGVDPGSINTGYGIIRKQGSKLQHITSGVISVKGGEINSRLPIIFTCLQEIIAKYQPQQMVIEQVFMSNNPQTAIKLGMARGVAILAGTLSKLPVFELSARQAKKFVTGMGEAKKEQVNKMVCKLLQLDTPPKIDASDALALAISHASTIKTRMVIAKRSAELLDQWSIRRLQENQKNLTLIRKQQQQELLETERNQQLLQLQNQELELKGLYTPEQIEQLTSIEQEDIEFLKQYYEEIDNSLTINTLNNIYPAKKRGRKPKSQQINPETSNLSFTPPQHIDQITQSLNSEFRNKSIPPVILKQNTTNVNLDNLDVLQSNDLNNVLCGLEQYLKYQQNSTSSEYNLNYDKKVEPLTNLHNQLLNLQNNSISNSTQNLYNNSKTQSTPQLLNFNHSSLLNLTSNINTIDKIKEHCTTSTIISHSKSINSSNKISNIQDFSKPSNLSRASEQLLTQISKNLKKSKTNKNFYQSSTINSTSKLTKDNNFIASSSNLTTSTGSLDNLKNHLTEHYTIDYTGSSLTTTFTNSNNNNLNQSLQEQFNTLTNINLSKQTTKTNYINKTSFINNQTLIFSNITKHLNNNYSSDLSHKLHQVIDKNLDHTYLTNTTNNQIHNNSNKLNNTNSSLEIDPSLLMNFKINSRRYGVKTGKVSSQSQLTEKIKKHNHSKTAKSSRKTNSKTKKTSKITT